MAKNNSELFFSRRTVNRHKTNEEYPHVHKESNGSIQWEKSVEEEIRIPADILRPNPSDLTSESRYDIKEDNGTVADNIASVFRYVNASSIGSVNITVHYHDKKT